MIRCDGDRSITAPHAEHIGPKRQRTVMTCAAGTPQHDMCEAQNWCTLRQQLGITSTAIACANQGGADSPVDSGGPVVKPAPKGCCDTGAGTAPTALGAGAIVATLLRRRRRRKL